MAASVQHRPAQRLLIVMPSWLGDTVMATPTLRALRQLYPAAHIAALVRGNLRPLVAECPWVDRILTTRPTRKGMADGRRRGFLALARRLSAGKFDTVVLLPNSFRTALLARLAGIPRRVGYERDGRGALLTDRLLPRRAAGHFVPVPTIDYYLGLARYLGAPEADPAMALFTRPDDDARARELLGRAGCAFRPDGRPERTLVILNPGASFGDTKMWYPERFAAVADRCASELGATVALSGAPKERAILDQVRRAARSPLIDLPALGLDLTLLKSVIRSASLLITNDTGPRHIAAAFGVPVVTVFGPTDPVWAHIGFAKERQVMTHLYCQPCQKKKCPLRGTPDDHQCMKQVGVEAVFAQVRELLMPR